MKSKSMLELKRKLEIAENNYQAFYEFAPVGYFDLDASHCVIKANLTGAQLLGVPRSRLFGKRFSAFINKESQSMFYMHLQQAVITKLKQTCEIGLLKKDGSSFYSQLEIVVVLDAIQHMSCLRLSIIDINEHRLTEQALRSSEEKFRSIIETTKEWIWAIDLKGRLLYSNPAVMNILGYLPAELLNKSCIMLIHKDDRPILTKILKSSIKENRGWSDLILRWRCKDGTYRFLESDAVPYFDSEDKLCGFRGADRDITARKLAEEKKARHQHTLNQISKMNSIGEFSSILAHELTQPVTAIIILLQVVLKE